MKGRKPQPRNDTTPQPPLGKPTCPRWLDHEAKAEWRRVLPLLDEMGVTSKVDGACLAVYCCMYSRWQKAEGMLQKEGYTVVCQNGYIQPSQWLNISNTAIKEMKAAMDDLGLTPKARTKLKALPRPSTDEKKWAALQVVGG